MSLLIRDLTADDRLAIHELISLYGHLIDDREFSRLDEIFTSDAVFDLTACGGECYFGLAAIKKMMISSQEHPLAHHSSNIVIGDADKASARTASVCVISKGLGVGYKGRVGSVTYKDVILCVNGLWRIKERLCLLRQANAIPDIS